MVTKNFIDECKTPAYEDRLGKIEIDGIEYNQENNLNSFEVNDSIYTNGNIIGSTYTKGLKTSLINVDKDTEFVGKEATVNVGVKYNDNSTEYMDLGDYIIEKINDEQTNNFTNLEGYDPLNNLDLKYEFGLGEGGHTLKEYFDDLVSNLGLETETEVFTNSDLLVSANPFIGNETNRIVLSEIEKVSCTYSKVEKRTRVVEGVTTTYYVLNLCWFSKLPVGYTELDYVESNGHQYIDTGVNADDKLRVVVDMQLVQGGTINQTNMGTIYKNGNTYLRYHSMISNNKFVIYNNTSNKQLGDSDYNRHIFDYDTPNHIYSLDNVGIEYDFGEFDTTLSFYLFGRHSNQSSIQYLSYMKIYSCKMYYEGELVRDFVPCYRNSDNKVGMYDLVNDVFYTNPTNTPLIGGGALNTSYEFTTSDYSTLEGSLNRYGPVNCVLLGSENIGGENVIRQDDESIAEYGETKLLIDSPYFLYTQELREQAIQGVADKLMGFQYYDLSLTTYYGKPFLPVGSKIRVHTNEDNVYESYVLQHEFSYNGTFKSVIKSPALSKQEEIVKTTESISSRVNKTEIMVDKANGTITSLTSRTEYLEDNTYTKEQTNKLVQDAESGLVNTFSKSGGNNIFRNTGLWFTATTSEATVLPSNSLFPSNDLFTGNKVAYEFWEGDANKAENDKAVNMTSIVLKSGYFVQEQKVPNGYFVVSFNYKKLIALATVKVKINDVEYILTSTEDTEFSKIINVTSQHINVQFYTDIDDSCEIYDLMVNAGQTKLAYSQNQNETTTDTVKIGQGITITSSNTDTIFRANADGIRTLDKSENVLTQFTDTGMTTKKMVVEDESQIVGTLWQEVGEQTWITRL